MYKKVFVLFAIILAFLETGCVSSGKKVLLGQRDPIALVSVVSNDIISWKDEDPIKPESVGMMARRSLREDPDLTFAANAGDLITTAETLFRDTMDGSALINLADNRTVLFSNAYRSADLNSRQIYRNLVVPEGYRHIDYRDKKFLAALESETGIQRTMFVEFVFSSAMSMGFGKNGTCRAHVEMTVTVLNAQGKNVFKKVYSLGSRPNMRVSNGLYSESEMIELFESAILDACYDFLDDLEK